MDEQIFYLADPIRVSFFFKPLIYIFLFGNVYTSTVKLNFKHWMSLAWISLVYYKRETWKLFT